MELIKGSSTEAPGTYAGSASDSGTSSSNVITSNNSQNRNKMKRANFYSIEMLLGNKRMGNGNNEDQSSDSELDRDAGNCGSIAAAKDRDRGDDEIEGGDPIKIPMVPSVKLNRGKLRVGVD